MITTKEVALKDGVRVKIYIRSRFETHGYFRGAWGRGRKGTDKYLGTKHWRGEKKEVDTCPDLPDLR